MKHDSLREILTSFDTVHFAKIEVSLWTARRRIEQRVESKRSGRGICCKYGEGGGAPRSRV